MVSARVVNQRAERALGRGAGDPGKPLSQQASPERTTKDPTGCFYVDQQATIEPETKRRRVMDWLYLVGFIIVWFILNRWILPRLGVQT
jgi:hypothetical protein